MAAIFTFDPSSIESLAKVGVHVCYCNGGKESVSEFVNPLPHTGRLQRCARPASGGLARWASCKSSQTSTFLLEEQNESMPIRFVAKNTTGSTTGSNVLDFI
jgi:hypothetical protein